MVKSQWVLDSFIGRLYLVASNKGLECVTWNIQRAPMAKSLRGSDKSIQILSQTKKQLQEYFSGQRRQFSIQLASSGTDFQTQVWSQLCKIPYGKTQSYKEIAQKIKNEKAVRAVGSANGKNPICIIVPCHRVISSDGSIGGYSGGLDIKSKLLNLEQFEV
jgi:methylated-DNA-[protein]-cysteine S-methyltransferase